MPAVEDEAAVEATVDVEALPRTEAVEESIDVSLDDVAEDITADESLTLVAAADDATEEMVAEKVRPIITEQTEEAVISQSLEETEVICDQPQAETV